MRDGETAQRQIAEANADKVQAQIELLEYEIGRADIVSPISGVVVKGDLKRQIGAPVKVGDVLFEVCPLESLRAQLLVPEDQISDAPERSLAAEITREKLYLKLHQELPYQSTVETEAWKELKDGVRIEQTIYVERESQKKIVLGKGGQTIKAIGEAARKEIAGITDAKVHLFLFVKVREGWGEDPERYRAMGLEFPKE